MALSLVAVALMTSTRIASQSVSHPMIHGYPH